MGFIGVTMTTMCSKYTDYITKAMPQIDSSKNTNKEQGKSDIKSVLMN